MISIAARAAALATSKSSNKSPAAVTIASAMWSTNSGVTADSLAAIAASLPATFAQNVPNAASQLLELDFQW
jgi:hypothetical protein